MWREYSQYMLYELQLACIQKVMLQYAKINISLVDNYE